MVGPCRLTRAPFSKEVFVHTAQIANDFARLSTTSIFFELFVELPDRIQRTRSINCRLVGLRFFDPLQHHCDVPGILQVASRHSKERRVQSTHQGVTSTWATCCQFILREESFPKANHSPDFCSRAL